MSNKIHVTNYNPAYDYSNAEQYGELIFMTKGYLPPSAHRKAEESFLAYATQASTDDYLMLSGSNIVCALALASWLSVFKSANLLYHVKGKGSGEANSPSYIICHVPTHRNQSQAAE